MTTKHKLIMFSAFCFAALSSFVFLDTADEKALISEKTEEKIIVEKKPAIKKEVIIEKTEKIVHKQKEPKKIAPIVKKEETKTVSEENNSTVNFKMISKDDVTEEMISSLSNDIFPDSEVLEGYIEKFGNHKFFKADFSTLSEKKVGEEVIINIAGKEYKGKLTESKSKPPTLEDLEHGSEDTFFTYDIQQEKEYATIFIHGWKNPSNSFYNGTITDLVSTDKDIQFFINNDIGIMMPDQEYNVLYIGIGSVE